MGRWKYDGRADIKRRAQLGDNADRSGELGEPEERGQGVSAAVGATRPFGR